MADWSRHFDEPIVLPGGRQLLTLEDAGTKLPKAEQDLEEWQTSLEALLLVVELNGAHHDGAHRCHEGIEPRPRAGV